jgi:hypothetical protein
MPRIKVRPEIFSMVDFDAAVIGRVTADVAELVGLPDDVEVTVEIDEATPFGASSGQVDGRSVALTLGGGAIEDPRNLRQFSESGARMVFGRLLFRVRDRLDPAFGEPPPDHELTLAQHTAWDTYAVGRWARRSGTDGREARRRYAYRLRHGFSDEVDSAFDLLWNSDGLTWADLDR